jgi:TRAP-type mannitol/chloroaromatic compound transport system permease small subunit
MHAPAPERLRRSHNDEASGGGDVRVLLKLSNVIDDFNSWVGRWLAWLVLVAVLVSAANATVRKVFDTSSNAWLELQWVLFSVVFLLCAAWTLKDNEHIRIDIVNNMMPRRARDVIELVGHALFLLPLTILMMVTSLPFFLRSFEINEQSMNAGGLPQWPAKSLVFIAFTMLFFQGISELIKRIAVMQGLIPDPHEQHRHPVEAEIAHLAETIEKR